MDILKPVDKRKLDELYRTYCVTHGVKGNFETFLSWLQSEGLLNIEKCKEYLKTKERK